MNMFNAPMVPYQQVVAAARDTAEKICARGSRPVKVAVTTEGGGTASVCWSYSRAQLNLPTIAPSTLMSRAEANQIVGLIAHECCHVMHSDWIVWTQAVDAGNTIKSLTNCIEDVRIEAAEIKRKMLPGLRDALSATCVMMHGKSLATAAQAGETIGSQAHHVGYLIAILGRLANKYAVPNAKDIQRGIDPVYAPIVDYALKRLPALKSTSDALTLAREVAAMLKAAQPTVQPQQPGQGDAGEGQGDAGEGQGDAGEGQGDAGEGQGGEGQGKGQGDAGEGQTTGQGSEQGPGNASGGAAKDLDNEQWLNSSPDVSDIARAKQDRSDHAYVTAQLNTFREPLISGQTARNPYDTSARDYIARPAVLCDAVTQLVLSSARNAHDRYLTAGRMDRRALSRAMWGSQNVFTRKTYTEGVETAVLLLVDGSYSMNADNRMIAARSLAYHLGMAIDAAGAQCAIAGFYIPQGNTPHVTLQLVKDFGETTELARVSSLGSHGGTWLSPAILAGAEMLAGKRDVQRRILLPLTDGDCDLGQATVREACTIATHLGVEVGGIGIGGGTNCQATFPVGVDLGDGANITGAGLQLLVDMLERQRGQW